jgi:hypothetical protein
MTNNTRASLGLLALLACMVAGASGLKPTSDKLVSWEAFWASVKVDPPPPRNFLEVSYHGRIDNLTQGRISNETARKWVLASLRRGKGDIYASHNLREDLANAGIFGPPGLNGTSEGIQSLRKRGVERVEGASMPNLIAVAVISVTKEMKAEEPRADLTDYVIVQLYQPSGPSTLIYRDGRREVREVKYTGELFWQLDTGHFFEHPTLGPLWYQKNGWSCQPGNSLLGKLCGRVLPDPDLDSATATGLMNQPVH